MEISIPTLMLGSIVIFMLGMASSVFADKRHNKSSLKTYVRKCAYAGARQNLICARTLKEASERIDDSFRGLRQGGQEEAILDDAKEILIDWWKKDNDPAILSRSGSTPYPQA